MEHERKELLAQKRAQLKIKQKRAEIQQYKDRLTKSIEHFSQKYRYADEAEALKIETFISKLNFEQPGQLAIQEVCPYLLLLDEDFIHYTYINDNGEVMESQVS